MSDNHSTKIQWEPLTQVFIVEGGDKTSKMVSHPNSECKILVPFAAWIGRDNFSTPFVSNYKASQKFWRVKAISNLTKIIKRNIKIYEIKLIYYENITNKESNDT